MKMFKKFASLIGVIAIAYNADAVTFSHFDNSFINNGTYLCLPNNATETFYPNGSGTNLWFYSYAVGTNILSGSTNSGGFTLPEALVPAEVTPDGNGDVNPNIALTATFNTYSGYQLPRYQSSAFLNTVWTNASAYYTNSVYSTNVVTFTFAPITDSSIQGTADTAISGKTFTWVVSLIGTTGQQTVSTNLAVGNIQGAAKVKLVSVVVSNVTNSQGVVLNSLKLSGWTP